MELAIIVAVVVVALVFDYTNGFHDAANAIATSVSTRALTPKVALAMAAAMNFLGAFLGQEVATTVSETISPGTGSAALLVVMAGLVGAIAWNMLTWWWGMPSSSTHALIGGLVGAAVAAGVTANWDVVVFSVLLPLLVVPFAAFGLAAAFMLAIEWAFRRVHHGRARRGFKLAQTVSAAMMALGHGLQDAQKTMGVIFLALVSGEYVAPGSDLPLWVVLVAATALSLGTLAGGWRIIRTLGRRLLPLDPPSGFAAETVSASILYATAYAFEAPVSTTHTITSAVVGVGAPRRLSAIRWGVARRVVLAWALTVPMAGLLAAAAYAVLGVVPV